MERKKNELLSFSAEQKESVSQALQKLMRGRTIREVSQAWGVASSNINNYLYRGSIPRADILKKSLWQKGYQSKTFSIYVRQIQKRPQINQSRFLMMN